MFFLLLLLMQPNGNGIFATTSNYFVNDYSVTNGDTFIIDFDRDDAGNTIVAGNIDFAATRPYANLFGTGSGITFSTDRPSSKPLNIYDSEGNTGEDPDLERHSEGTGLWEAGNLTDEPLYNLLIINKDMNIGTPNDNGNGGQTTLHSDRMLQSFFFSFVDLDAGRVASSTITFTNTMTNETATISFADLEGDSGSVHATPNVDFGDRHGNQVNPILASNLGISEFDQVTFSQTGSGGIGSMIVQTSAVVCTTTVCQPVTIDIDRTEN